jgi:hypothetical protein
MSKKLNEVELTALKDERHDLMTQLVRMTQEYVNTTTPLHRRLLAVEDKLDAAGWL